MNENKKRYWFKRKRFGYGWVPVTKEGIGVVLLYIFIIIAGSLTLSDVPEGQFTKELGFYFTFLAISTVALIRITLAKGPKPRWRWGWKDGDNREEDF